MFKWQLVGAFKSYQHTHTVGCGTKAMSATMLEVNVMKVRQQQGLQSGSCMRRQMEGSRLQWRHFQPLMAPVVHGVATSETCNHWEVGCALQNTSFPISGPFQHALSWIWYPVLARGLC